MQNRDYTEEDLARASQVVKAGDWKLNCAIQNHQIHVLSSHTKPAVKVNGSVNGIMPYQSRVSAQNQRTSNPLLFATIKPLGYSTTHSSQFIHAAEGVTPRLLEAKVISTRS